MKNWNRFLKLTALLLTLTLHGFSQEKTFPIDGRVTDPSGQPLSGASVFCQNTTVGTLTRSDGGFHLRLATGGYDLVISYTGYETQVIRIGKDHKDTDSINVQLKEQDKSMEQVVVAGSAEVADGWDKYGQFFIDHFIGTTPNASSCTLENKEVLKFYFYKKRNKLRIKAASPLIVDNNALGYKIHYQLDSFVYEYNSNISTYTGYPLFEEMQGTPEQQDTWKQNRLDAYVGSRLHFVRSWYDSTLKDEGFVLEFADSTNLNKFKKLEDPYSANFYSVDSGDVQIDLPGRLRVSYTKLEPDRKYLVENKYPLTTRIQISAIDIANSFVIEQNGYFYDQSDITNIGYWAWKRLAELLPYDYNP